MEDNKNMKRKTTNVACHLICKKHIYSVKFTDVFFIIVYLPPCSQHKLWIWWQTSSAILLFMIDSISYILLKINTFFKNKFSHLNYIHNLIIWKIFFHLFSKKNLPIFSKTYFIHIFSFTPTSH